MKRASVFRTKEFRICYAFSSNNFSYVLLFTRVQVHFVWRIKSYIEIVTKTILKYKRIGYYHLIDDIIINVSKTSNFSLYEVDILDTEVKGYLLVIL